MTNKLRLASTKQDYQKLQISNKTVCKKEDGVHILGKNIEYEWWYFDVKLNNGGTLVIVFHYRSFVTHKPIIQFNYTPKHGEPFEQVLRFHNSEARADVSQCNVMMGNNYFRGDLNKYEIHIDTNDLKADIKLNTLTTPWRPKTGYLYFNNDQKYFAWLPSVPYGDVIGNFQINGKTISAKGFGYHDHNWGNETFMKLFDHWYWGRAHIGKYDVISSYLMGAKKYDFKPTTYFMIQENGKVITKDDESYVNFELKNICLDKKTNKQYAKEIIYTYDDGGLKVIVKYKVDKIIECTKFIDKLPIFKFNDKLRAFNIKTINSFRESLHLCRFHGWGMIDKLRSFNRNLASKLLKFTAAYLRFNGSCEITIYKNNILKDKITSEATWELMAIGDHK